MTSEKNFIPFLQKNISIMLDNKTLKQGRLLLFCIKDFYLNFTLMCGNGTKTFELPYPFDTYMESLTSHVLILDYKLKTLTNTVPSLDENVSLLSVNGKPMKFFNNTVKIIETK